MKPYSTAQVIQFPTHEQPEREQPATVSEGFTKMPNSILAALMVTNLSKHEGRVLSCIAKNTLQFHKDMAWVSGSLICKDTGLSKSRVSEALNKLISRGIVIKEGRNIGINLDVNQWDSEPTCTTESKQKVPQNRNKSSVKVEPEVPQNRNSEFRETGNNKEIINKEISNKEKTSSAVAQQAREVIRHLNTASGRKFKGSKADIATISARLREGFTVDELNRISDYKNAEWGKDPRWSKYLRPETLFAAKHTDSYLNEALAQQDCPHMEILAIWAEVMPELPQPNPSEWNLSRTDYHNLAARWIDGLNTLKRDSSEPLYHDTETGLAWWRRFFMHIRKSDVLMSKIKGMSLGWILDYENYLGIKEGKYHDAK